MAGRLLSLWNKIIGRKSPSNYNQEMRDKLSNLMHFLDSKNDIETWLLGLSLCLEELPEGILDFRPLLRGRLHNMYCIGYGMDDKKYTVKELINLTLNYDQLNVNAQYTYRLFVRGTILTIHSVLFHAWCQY